MKQLKRDIGPTIHHWTHDTPLNQLLNTLITLNQEIDCGTKVLTIPQLIFVITRVILIKNSTIFSKKKWFQLSLYCYNLVQNIRKVPLIDLSWNLKNFYCATFGRKTFPKKIFTKKVIRANFKPLCYSNFMQKITEIALIICKTWKTLSLSKLFFFMSSLLLAKSSVLSCTCMLFVKNVKL